MTELEHRLREAGHLLDERAPTFDAARFVARAGPIDHKPEPMPLTAERSDGGRFRPRTIVLVAAAVLVLVAGVAALRLERDTIITGPVAPGPDATGRAAPSTEAVTSAIPDVLEVTCGTQAVTATLSTGEVRPRTDGVHVLVHSSVADGVLVDLGPFGSRQLGVGDTSFVVPVTPGAHRVSCAPVTMSASPPWVDVEVVDPLGVWIDPTLPCENQVHTSASGNWADVPVATTPEEAVAAWSSVGPEVDLRRVEYPEAEAPVILASTPTGSIRFATQETESKAWLARPSGWCSPTIPQASPDDDVLAEWYDRERVADVLDGIDEQLGDRPPKVTDATDSIEIRMWCTDLSLHSRFLGDLQPAPDPVIDAALADALGSMAQAVSSCPLESTTVADGAFAESDAALATARQEIAELRVLLDARL